jgi:hypothetical protein
MSAKVERDRAKSGFRERVDDARPAPVLLDAAREAVQQHDGATVAIHFVVDVHTC